MPLVLRPVRTVRSFAVALNWETREQWSYGDRNVCAQRSERSERATVARPAGASRWARFAVRHERRGSHQTGSIFSCLILRSSAQSFSAVISAWILSGAGSGVLSASA